MGEGFLGRSYVVARPTPLTLALMVLLAAAAEDSALAIGGFCEVFRKRLDIEVLEVLKKDMIDALWTRSSQRNLI